MDYPIIKLLSLHSAQYPSSSTLILLLLLPGIIKIVEKCLPFILSSVEAGYGKMEFNEVWRFRSFGMKKGGEGVFLFSKRATFCSTSLRTTYFHRNEDFFQLNFLAFTSRALFFNLTLGNTKNGDFSRKGQFDFYSLVSSKRKIQRIFRESSFVPDNACSSDELITLLRDFQWYATARGVVEIG